MCETKYLNNKLTFSKIFKSVSMQNNSNVNGVLLFIISSL